MPFIKTTKFTNANLYEAGELTAAQSDVVYGKKYVGSDGVKTGSLPILPDNQNDIVLAADGSYTVAVGKNPTQFNVKSKSLAEQTYEAASVAATAGNIAKDKKAYVNGVEITGTLDTIDPTVVIPSLGAGESYTIPAGVHVGTQVVTVKSLAELTPVASANVPTASDMASGKTAYANGNTINGGLTVHPNTTIPSLGAGESYTIPAGIHSGSQVITVKSLAELTPVASANVPTASDMASGKTAYANGNTINGGLAVISPVTTTISPNTDQLIPAGIHDGTGIMRCNVETYTGATVVTPTDQQQTLETLGKLLTSNITINAGGSGGGGYEINRNVGLSVSGFCLNNNFSEYYYPEDYNNWIGENIISLFKFTISDSSPYDIIVFYIFVNGTKGERINIQHEYAYFESGGSSIDFNFYGSAEICDDGSLYINFYIIVPGGYDTDGMYLSIDTIFSMRPISS